LTRRPLRVFFYSIKQNTFGLSARIHSLYYCIAKSKNTLWRPATHSILGAISFKNIHHRKTNESFTLTLKKLFR
jgi:hypothetical protein